MWLKDQYIEFQQFTKILLENINMRVLCLLLVGICLILIVFFIIKRVILAKKPHFDGFLLYGRSKLKNRIELRGNRSLRISVGSETVSDHHILIDCSNSFMFTVTPVKASNGLVYIHISCEPPGMFRYDGCEQTEFNFFGGERFSINDVSFKYQTNEVS